MPRKFIPPSLEEFVAYFVQNGYAAELGEQAWKGYDVADWYKSNGKPVLNWKQTCHQVWFKVKPKSVMQQNLKAAENALKKL